MAVGDVIADIDSIASASPVDFQPASGVEIRLIGFGTSGTTGDLFQNNGTVSAAITVGQSTTAGGFILNFGITNTVYLTREPTTGTMSIAYSGVQIK